MPGYRRVDIVGRRMARGAHEAEVILREIPGIEPLLKEVLDYRDHREEWRQQELLAEIEGLKEKVTSCGLSATADALVAHEVITACDQIIGELTAPQQPA